MSAVTAAALDPFDTQMLDYSTDLDVPMQSSAETWMAPMDDDTQMRTQPPSVEIDMELYEGDFAEYEMGDDQDIVYHPSPGELLDVEVYDASQIQTPRLIPEFELHPAPPDSHPENLAFVPEVDAQVVPLPQSLDPSSETAHGALEYPVYQYAAPTEIPEETHQAVVPQANTADSEPLEVSANESSWKAASDTPHVISVEHGYVEATVTESESPDAHSRKGDRQADANAEIYALHSLEGDIEEVGSAEPKHADPHEISEGVYIDPPPAVLLSLPSSVEPDYSLFNQPASTLAAANFPQTMGTKAFTLLLHHRPTLYYEPLAHVFEVLRQDAEFIARIPDAAEGELALDAYDVHLSISEDNVYAREISLHDLNVIHDGTGFSGPLRIQIGSIVPRFISRYHSLQEQIARINLTAEQTNTYEVVEGKGATEEESDHLELHGERGVYDSAPKEDELSRSLSQEGQVPLEPSDQDEPPSDNHDGADGHQDAPEESTQQTGDEESDTRRAQRPASNALGSPERLSLALKTFDTQDPDRDHDDRDTSANTDLHGARSVFLEDQDGDELNHFGLDDDGIYEDVEELGRDAAEGVDPSVEVVGDAEDADTAEVDAYADDDAYAENAGAEGADADVEGADADTEARAADADAGTAGTVAVDAEAEAEDADEDASAEAKITDAEAEVLGSEDADEEGAADEPEVDDYLAYSHDSSAPVDPSAESRSKNHRVNSTQVQTAQALENAEDEYHTTPAHPLVGFDGQGADEDESDPNFISALEQPDGLTDNLASSGLYVQEPEAEEGFLYDPNNQDWYYHGEDDQFDPNESRARPDDHDAADQDAVSSGSSSTLSSIKLSGKRTYDEFEEDGVDEVDVEEQPLSSPGMYPYLSAPCEDAHKGGDVCRSSLSYFEAKEVAMTSSGWKRLNASRLATPNS